MDEIFLVGYPSGLTVYALVRNSSGQIWYPTSEEFEDFGTSSRSHADYDIAMTDKSGGMYVGDFPSAIPANTSVGYRTIIYRQLGASPASSDHIIGGAKILWTGSAAAAADVEANVTALANRMFLKLGGGTTNIIIDDIDDATNEDAVIAKTIYTQVRNEVLARWPWKECREFADLGAEVSGLNMADWDYAFELPANFISLIAQIDEADSSIEFESEVRGAYLFTRDYSNVGEDSAYIDYIKKITDTSEYSPQLFEAIATKWAAELAPKYNPKEKDNLKREFEFLVLPNAKAANQQSQYSDDKGEYSWRNARTS